MTELLGSHPLVAWAAQVLGVAIVVAAAVSERDDVIDHRCERGDIQSIALPTAKTSTALT